MSFIAPNTFVNGAPFNGTNWQENSDELRNYLDGGMSASDIDATPGGWIRAPHIMRGTYFPLNNTHEFTTGIVRGGFFQNTNVQIGADRFRCPYNPLFQTVDDQVFWTIDFVPQASSAKIRLSWQIHPKHPPGAVPFLDTTQGARQNFDAITVHPNFTQDDSTMGVSNVGCQEHAGGNFRDSQNLGPGSYDFGTGTPGKYRRRVHSNFIYDTFNNMTPGDYYHYRFYIGTNVVLNDYAELNYSFELYYV